MNQEINVVAVVLNVGQILKLAAQQLAALNIHNARLDARLLLAHVMNVNPVELIISCEKILSTIQYTEFQLLIQRRLAFEPVSRIVGKREFWGLDFNISPATLDPRADSETLIDAVLNHTSDRLSPVDILDLGTGTGCLLLTLLHELSHAHGIGVDISIDAINIACQNANRLALASRATFKHQDWRTPLSGQYDWIISNPPYIPHNDIAILAPDVRLYDPLLALDGGDDGLECYRLLAQILQPLLKPNGRIAIEIGYNQASAVEILFRQQGFNLKQWALDLAGIQRCGIFTKA